MSKKELTAMYGVSLFTFKCWIVKAKLIGENRLFETDLHYNSIRLFTPLQIEKIFEALGEPE